MTPEEFRGALDAAKNRGSGLILLATHERPDGDAVSSITSTAGILADAGYSVKALLPSPVPDAYTAYAPEKLTVRSAENLSPELFITLDCSNPERIAAAGFPFREAPAVINIDHHPDNGNFASMQLVRPDAAATALVLFDLFRKGGFFISKENATRLLLGITTDTGCFRFDNTSPEALEAAAELIRMGADRHSIVVNAYESLEESYVRLEADLIANHLRTAFGGRAGWFVLTKALLAKYSVDVRNTENLIDAVRNIRGVEFAALLREEPGGYKLSLRTKNAPYSAGRVARRLNGGGHEMAAGGFIPAKSAEEAGNILLENIQTELEGS